MSTNIEPRTEENNESLYERVSFMVDKGQTPMRIDKWLQARIEGITRNKLQIKYNYINLIHTISFLVRS